MSVPEWDVRFAPAARRDLRSIALHTRRVWGSERQASYRAALEKVFRLLGEHPQVGRPRDDLFPGCRSIPAEQNEVVQEALRLLNEHERLQHLRALLEVGRQDGPRGDLIAFTPE